MLHKYKSYDVTENEDYLNNLEMIEKSTSLSYQLAKRGFQL